jgi:hexokinase
VGQDICHLLETAFQQGDIGVKVTALINDTVGTLITGAYMFHPNAKCAIGLILGTGISFLLIDFLFFSLLFCLFAFMFI